MPIAYDNYLNRNIEYVPETGEIIGAGSAPNGDGYYQVYYNGEQITVSKFAWFVMTGAWPNGIVDHKDRNRANNKWNNLRHITISENNRNRTKLYGNHKYIGVTFEGMAKCRYSFVIDGIRYRKAGFRCQTKAALERDKCILRLGEKFTTLNILSR